MIVLGIETSCDETAVAVIADDKTIMANLVLSQLEERLGNDDATELAVVASELRDITLLRLEESVTE